MYRLRSAEPVSYCLDAFLRGFSLANQVMRVRNIPGNPFQNAGELREDGDGTVYFVSPVLFVRFRFPILLDASLR